MAEVQRQIRLPVAQQTRQQLPPRQLTGVIRELYCLLPRPLRAPFSVLAHKVLRTLSRDLLHLELHPRTALRIITTTISKPRFRRSLAVSFLTLFFHPPRASSRSGVLVGLGPTVICCPARLRSRLHRFRTVLDSRGKTKWTRSARAPRAVLAATRAARG